MSDDTERDDLRERLDEIEERLTDDEITVTCEVVTITPDMVDDNGTIESKLPDPRGKVLEVPSDVVRWTKQKDAAGD